MHHAYRVPETGRRLDDLVDPSANPPLLAAAITPPAPAGLAIESGKRSGARGRRVGRGERRLEAAVSPLRGRDKSGKEKKECRGELHVTVSAGLHGRAPTFPPPSPYRAPLDQRASTTPLTARENERDAPTPDRRHPEEPRAANTDARSWRGGRGRGATSPPPRANARGARGSRRGWLLAQRCVRCSL